MLEHDIVCCPSVRGAGQHQDNKRAAAAATKEPAVC